MIVCIKQHLNNIWSSIHEKLSNTKAELKKKLLIKNACTTLTIGFNCPGVYDLIIKESNSQHS